MNISSLHSRVALAILVWLVAGCNSDKPNRSQADTLSAVTTPEQPAPIPDSLVFIEVAEESGLLFAHHKGANGKILH